MAKRNLTLAIDEDLLREARKRALDEGTSVNAVLRGYLESYVGRRHRQARAAEELLDIFDRYPSGSGPGGRDWTRDDLHDRWDER